MSSRSTPLTLLISCDWLIPVIFLDQFFMKIFECFFQKHEWGGEGGREAKGEKRRGIWGSEIYIFKWFERHEVKTGKKFI